MHLYFLESKPQYRVLRWAFENNVWCSKKSKNRTENDFRKKAASTIIHTTQSISYYHPCLFGLPICGVSFETSSHKWQKPTYNAHAEWEREDSRWATVNNIFAWTCMSFVPFTAISVRQWIDAQMLSSFGQDSHPSIHLVGMSVISKSLIDYFNAQNVVNGFQSHEKQTFFREKRKEKLCFRFSFSVVLYDLWNGKNSFHFNYFFLPWIE